MEPDNPEKCIQCPRLCEVDRILSRGYCKAPDELKINLYQLHFGEEPVITGTHGSGTIFFSYCNLRCVFCQNYKISDWGNGERITVSQLADIMLELQNKGAHNINLVTPTHYSYYIKEALILAKNNGLHLPIVWNSNGYENVEILKEMEGLIDIYLPDFKYWDNESAQTYSQAPNYPEVAKEAIMEMYRQVGHLKIDEDDNLAYRGLLIRLLVLPNNVNGIESILHWIYENLGNNTFISLMSQYYPTHRADEFEKIKRPLIKEEYDYAVHIMNALGFENGFIQEMGITPEWTPDFKEFQ
jgi:putative pyruvate formate lyase activating enzyme